jgi:hypothetical protein
MAKPNLRAMAANAPSIVHTGLAVGTAGGVSDALVTILVWLLSLLNVAVPDKVAAAFGVLFTVAIGLVIHRFLSKALAGAAGADVDDAPAPATAASPALEPAQPAAKAA